MRVVITGGPGAGKTTLLAELAAMGYTTVEESARAIITERLANGLSRRPEPALFAREILRRDIQKYLEQAHIRNWVFFDRGVIEALAMVQEVSPLPADELHAMLAEYPFHRSVFILPPWESIYTTEAERDQTFADAVNVHRRIVQWYTTCGYALLDVPRFSARERANYVLGILDAA